MPKPPPIPPELITLTPQQAVEYLAENSINVTVRALRTEHSSGRLRHRKIAGRVHYRLGDLWDWLAREDSQEPGSSSVARAREALDRLRRVKPQ